MTYIDNLSIPHIDNMSICSMDETICQRNMYKFSICCMELRFFFHTIYGQFDIEKPNFLLHKGNFITLFNYINALIHKKYAFHKFV